MSATPPEAPATPRAREWPAREPDPRPRGFAAWFASFVAQEMAPTPYRLRQTLRIATLSALGAGLAAVLQLPDGFGPMTLWRILATQSPLMTFPQLALLTGAAGFGESAAVVLAGILVEAPWLQLAFFGAAAATAGYLTQVLELGSAWVMIQIGVLSTFFVITLDAAGAGWAAAYAFAGMAMAYVVVYLADNFLWPGAAERALLESLGDRLERKRRRLEAAAVAYFAPEAAAALKPTPVYTLLATHLGLLKRVEREQPDARRRRILTAAVTQGEQLHHAVEVIVYLSREGVGARQRGDVREELEAALAAAIAALDELAGRVRAGLVADGGAAPLAATLTLEAALARLDVRMAALGMDETGGADFAEIANLAALVAELRRMARLLARTLERTVPALGAAAPETPGLAGPARLLATRGWRRDPQALRHAIKIGLASTIAFVVGLTAGRGELSVMIWSVLTVGPPTYGAQVRKMILRLAGGIIGGLIAIPTIMILSPNSVSVGAYVFAIFVVLLCAAYLATSTSRISYAGVQGGISFMVAVVSLAPSVAVTEPLWRVWGIALGLIITTVVFLTLWPEYAGDALLGRMPEYLAAALELIPPPGALPPATGRTAALELELARTHSQMLAIAEDARLEGDRAGIDHRAVIDASSALLRIGYRSGELIAARAAEASEDPAPAAEFVAARADFAVALRAPLVAWRDYFLRVRAAGRAGSEPIAPPIDLGERIAPLAANLERTAAAAPTAALMAQSEAYRRIALRAAELDEAFRRIRVN